MKESGNQISVFSFMRASIWLSSWRVLTVLKLWPFHLFLFLRCVQQRITGERPKLEIRGQRRSIEREFLSNYTLEFSRCHLPFNRYPTETSISQPFPLWPSKEGNSVHMWNKDKNRAWIDEGWTLKQFYARWFSFSLQRRSLSSKERALSTLFALISRPLTPRSRAAEMFFYAGV